MALAHGDIIRIIEKVPPAERNMPALVIDDEVYTWNQALDEMRKKSELSGRMLNKIEEMIKEYEKRNNQVHK